jgi:3-oxoacyl-[acyl-carrier protein] reductase
VPAVAKPFGIVTGGAQGLGEAIAARLLSEGWDIEIWDVQGSERWHRSVDVRDRMQVREAMARAVGSHQRLDLLVNNAGVTNHRPLESISWEDWSHVIDVDLHGVFNCLQAAGCHMLERGGGSIVNIASIAALRGAPGRAAYSTAKAGVIGLTRAAAVEWAPRGVRVNAVGPGYVDSGLYRAGVMAGTLDPSEVLRRIPMGRVALPEEIASMVVYLASDRASYITGQTMYVDGGFLADYGVNATVGSALAEPDPAS